MNLRIRIDRLVLDDVPLPAGRPAAFTRAFRRELERQLGITEWPMQLTRSAHIARLRADAGALRTGDASAIAGQLAHAVSRGLLGGSER